jgi:hypothetical protein
MKQAKAFLNGAKYPFLVVIIHQNLKLNEHFWHYNVSFFGGKFYTFMCVERNVPS